MVFIFLLVLFCLLFGVFTAAKWLLFLALAIFIIGIFSSRGRV